MVALIAGAALAHDAGARRTAGVLTFAAALVRPEVWPFALIYGVWLVGSDRRQAVGLVACIAVVLVAWAVPELLHTGATAVGAATGKATSASARYSSIPFLAVFKDAFDRLTVVPGVLAALALVAIGVQIASSGRTGGPRRVLASFTLEWAIGLFAVGWIAAEMRRELAVRHCPGMYWTFAANRSTLAQLTGQSVGQSAHKLGFRVRLGQFVYCAPPSASRPDGAPG